MQLLLALDHQLINRTLGFLKAEHIGPSSCICFISLHRRSSRGPMASGSLEPEGNEPRAVFTHLDLSYPLPIHRAR